uniref:Protein kinase domain-containing protein n=1 Tax=Anabas testudineus TaxID=64144 RepID=A0A3Q1JSK2_ANATE
MEEESSNPDVYPIPSEYELVDFVGSGDFGIVVKCKKRDTGETVAIKVSRLVQYATREVGLLTICVKSDTQ